MAAPEKLIAGKDMSLTHRTPTEEMVSANAGLATFNVSTATWKGKEAKMSTGRELLHHLQEKIEEEISLDAVMTIPILLHIKPAFERMYWDVFYDPATPCPHEGTKWSLEDGVQRCGMCGRKIEKEKAA